MYLNSSSQRQSLHEVVPWDNFLLVGVKGVSIMLYIKIWTVNYNKSLDNLTACVYNDSNLLFRLNSLAPGWMPQDPADD